MCLGKRARSPLRHQRVLFSIASGHPIEGSAIVESLKDAALIYEEQGDWFPFSEEFGRFVRVQEHPREGFPVNPGEVLWDQYLVVAVIGHTLHSQVVKAQHIHLKRYQAIKLLSINMHLTDEQVETLSKNLVREAHILASLQHKNIVKVHDVRVNPLGMIMAWVEGRSLHKILDEREVLPLPTIRKIGAQLADALYYVHQQGIVHRDIKPGNIILTPDDDLVLIDFDIARSPSTDPIIFSEESSQPAFVGIPAYSAPEQFIQPGLVGPSADIFALGVVLYELLTFEHPYPYGHNPKNYPDARIPQFESATAS